MKDKIKKFREDLGFRKDLKDLEERVKVIHGEKIFNDIINYSFDFCLAEAQYLGIDTKGVEFDAMCMNRRIHTLNRVIEIYRIGAEMPCRITIGLYDEESLNKIVRKWYGENDKKER